MADVFTSLSKGTTYTSLKDEHELIQINDKHVTVGKIGKIVCGDINSQAIEFSIPRYYDGVDLLTKKFLIIYENKGGVFKSEGINVVYNKEEIRFTWLLDEKATLYSGDLKCAVMASGTDEKGKTYVLKTEKFNVPITESISEYGIEGVYESWATDVDIKLKKIEQAVSENTNTFMGTQEEYNKAVSAGQIKDGMIVIITTEN